jgi:hypothetical protein
MQEQSQYAYSIIKYRQIGFRLNKRGRKKGRKEGRKKK